MNSPNPLALWRARHGLSNAQAGEMFGVDKGRWWRIENGHIRPEDDLESRIVLATGVTRDQLACLRKQQGERVREKKRA